MSGRLHTKSEVRERERQIVAEPATKVGWGPCCFCGENIAPSDTDPCRVQVTVANGKWQVWSCHAKCFRDRLTQRPDLRSLLDPAHF